MRRRDDPESPRFPPVESAPANGLVLVGGLLSPEWMLAAYSRGIFPMPIVEAGRETLAWFSPDPRGVIELDGVHISRSLQRTLRRDRFRFTHDQAFLRVVEACARPRDDEEDGVWITPALIAGYERLFARGHAHSVEVWEEETLVGGIFGVSVGGFFAGESMFHRTTDASKAALVELAGHLRRRGFELFDVQWSNTHTRTLGAVDIPRAEYLDRLASAVVKKATF